MKSPVQNKPLTGNIWKFYVYKGFWGLSMGLLVPVVVLFYLDRGISLAGFMVLMASLDGHSQCHHAGNGSAGWRYRRQVQP